MRLLQSAALIALTGLCSLASACQSETPAAAKVVVKPVKIMVVGAVQSSQTRRYPGRLEACRKADLSFRVAGNMVELPVKAGQEVKKGQLLARLDARDFKIRLARAKSTYVELKSQYHRYQKLVKSHAVSQSAFEATQRAFEVAKAALEEAEAALADTRMLAPFDGMVARVYLENHQEVKAKQSVLSLQDISQLEIVVQVPEQDVIEYRGHDAYDTKVVVDALPHRVFEARTKEFTTEADPITQTYTATLIMPNPGDCMVLPGMTAEVHASMKASHGVEGNGYQVPVQAVFTNPAGQWRIWRVDPETNKVRSVLVNPGGIKGPTVLVRSGLKQGDIIVVAGVQHLSEEMEVKPLKSPAAGAKR